MVCTLYRLLYGGEIKENEMGGGARDRNGEERNAEGCLVGKSGKERGDLEELEVDERLISKWILWKWNERARFGLIWLRVGTNVCLMLIWQRT
jgi:hypothetical protein